jgi:2-oxoglutarate ferredoxin oxidoreductase subunit alpha
MPKPEDEFSLQRFGMVTNEQLPVDDSFRRYQITDSGISPRSVPGQPHGLQITNSYEHDEFGYATEDADMTIKQVEKRARKLLELEKEIPQPYIVGAENADITFVCWGSTLSVTQQLIHDLPTYNLQLTANCIHIPCIWPFPKTTFLQLTGKAKQLVMIEGNHTGQAEQLIRQETGITFEKRIRRFDGRPFYTEDIIEELKSKF